MPGKILVRHYMSRRIAKLKPDMEILTAVHALLEFGVSGAPVVDNSGSVVGVLTERDCMKVVLDASYYQEPGGLVEEFMTKHPEVLAPDLSIVDAARLFYENRYLRYPVVDSGRLVGVLSRSDVMRAMGDYWKA